MKKYIKYIVFIGLIIILVVGLNWPTNNEVINVEMSVKDYGKLTLELDKENAPITVDNFVKLVNNKFYDGLTFHRIIDGFMIQGGDPNKDGTGGSKETIKGEFKNNGVNNIISHKRGVISMARSSDANSASSQFFIMHKDNTNLDGSYAAFGHVISGMDVVDTIVKNTSTYGDENGIVPVDKQPVIEYIKIIKNEKTTEKQFLF